MSADFIAALAPLFADTVVAQPGAMDGYGDWVSSGSTLNLTCHIEGGSRLVRSSTGHEVTSSLTIYVAGYNDLSVERHRYTVPGRYDPGTLLVAVNVEKYTDENGACYEVVNLP